MKNKSNAIAEQLQARIDNGEYTDRLPSEQDLAKDFHTTNNTIRKALDQLLRDEKIIKVPYVGTFINKKERKTIRIFWPDATFPQAENQLIQDKVQRHFPEFDIRFSKETPPTPDNWETVEYDLIRIIGTNTLSYSECTMPLPMDVVRKYQNNEFFSAPFNIHRINNFYYALPILFSPTVLMIKPAVLNQFRPDIGLYDLTWELMLEIAAWAKAQRYYLWNADTAQSLLRCLIFSTGNVSGLLHDVNIARIRRQLQSLAPLFDPELICEDKANPDKTLFWWTCRQNTVYPVDGKQYSLLAFPRFSNEQETRNMATGEFLMLSAHSRVSEEALAVGEYFLSPDIQSIIGKFKTGLPVLKSAAMDSLDFRNPLDTLYLGEIDNMLANNATEQDFLLRLKTFSLAMFAGTMALDKFIDYLDYEFEMSTTKEDARHHVLNSIFYESAGH